MVDINPELLAPGDAAMAAELRDRFAFLRDTVTEMERHVPYASALVLSRDGLRLDLRDAEQTATRLDPRSGVVLTVSNGYGLEEASTHDLDPATVRSLATALVDRARAYQPRADETPLGIEVPPLGDHDYATPVVVDPASVALPDKLARFGALQRQARAMDERATQVICQYGEQAAMQVFVNRGGMVTQQIRRTLLQLVLFVSNGEQQRYHYLARAGTGGLEQIELDDDDLNGLAEVAVSLLGAGPIPPGTYEVVSDPWTSGTIAHEAFGHGVETDMFLKDRARAAAYIGRRVGSSLVNIVDDPTLSGGYGSYFVDDEGQPASPTHIIRDGILERGLTDLYSATRLGIARSANGRRESVQRKAYARMSNTFFAPGANTREELLASLDDGVLLCDAGNGMEDPKGWGIQIWAQYAREYRAGRPTGRIFSPVAITGYVPELLDSVTMVSNELEFQAGTCGKGWKELVPVGSGGPYLRTRCRLG